ncbi:MAG: twin-arginine translocation signal domain-containing protein [Acidobacteriota bacterium]
MSTERIHRRNFIKQTAAAGLALSAWSRSSTALAQKASAEWRNRQSEMVYRRLGRTGMMISEVVSGGDPIRLPNYEHLHWLLMHERAG